MKGRLGILRWKLWEIWKLWVPIWLGLLVCLSLWWLNRESHMASEVASQTFPFLFLVFLAFWWALVWSPTRGKRIKRLLGVVGTLLVLGMLFRYEGFSSGGWRLKFVPRWAETEVGKASPTQELQKPSSEGEKESRASKTEAVAVPEGAGNFPAYLGAERQGVVKSKLFDAIAPGDQDALQELWRIKVGEGWGGFVVQDGIAITMEQRGQEELVSAYILASGESLWSHAREGRFSEPMGGDGPRSTPSIKDGVVYALGANGDLQALDLQSGELKWEVNILQDAGAERNLEWATTCSPLVYQGKVYVFGGRGNAKGRLLAYKAETGQFLWAQGKGDATYSSPCVATLEDVEQILCTNADSISGHDPETGKELWNFPWNGMLPIKAAQPRVLENGDVYCSAGYQLGSVRISVKRDGEKWVVEEVWSNARRMKTKFSNVSIVGKYAFGLDEGRWICQDLETGERVWKEEKYGYGQQLLVGSRVLVQAERGYLVLLETNAEAFEEVVRWDALSSKTWNSLCVAGEYVLVRNDREAVCFRVR